MPNELRNFERHKQFNTMLLLESRPTCIFLGHTYISAKFDHRAAILSCLFGGSTHAYNGCLDTGVHELDLSTEKVTSLGQHANAASALSDAREINTLISGSWYQSPRFWEPRAPKAEVSNHTLPERVYHMDIVNNTLVVSMASRLFHIYDVRRMSEPAQTRESSLKFMTRGYAIGSVEGRIVVEYLDPSPEAQEKTYAFKCHRKNIEDVDHVWPINALAFHPVHNTFASAGSDGTVSIWDHKYPKYASAIPSIAFNCDGTHLAVGVSYTWDEGEDGLKKEGGTTRAV
ncbi:WD40 repeat-like protein [Rhizopogon vinicolor AM-OR11-026]|uniref:WD40 repeat-like protein n=1 Tax=Rhizopogon vinicolor AM-OR11-026 TaxID=1314800 RepID=A0A1B7MJA3_9AGAM|nr:WD40 repeat-like protein [Rhizopogon vinicolor AM-OR11-026]